jgi:hypothetical protein
MPTRERRDEFERLQVEIRRQREMLESWPKTSSKANDTRNALLDRHWRVRQRRDELLREVTSQREQLESLRAEVEQLLRRRAAAEQWAYGHPASPLSPTTPFFGVQFLDAAGKHPVVQLVLMGVVALAPVLAILLFGLFILLLTS